MAGFAAVYVWRVVNRDRFWTTQGFYLAVGFYGAQRFVWEFLKPYPKLIGPFNLFHVLSAGLVIYGWIWWARSGADERGAQERAVPVSRPDHGPV